MIRRPPGIFGASCDGNTPGLYVGGDAGGEHGEVRAVQLNRIVRRLQTALCMQGRRIRINQYQHYSEKAERMVTKYVLSMEQDSGGRRRSVVILETYRLAEVVQVMAGLLNGGGDG